MEKAAMSKIKPVMENLNASYGKIHDAYICDIETFEMVYKLEKKRAKRRGASASIISLKVIGEGLIDEDLNEISARLLKIFKDYLRPDDLVCRLDENNFVLLVNNIEDEELLKILNRLNYFFYSLSEGAKSSKCVEIFKRTGLVWDYNFIEHHSRII